MTMRTTTINQLDTAPISVRGKLAAAWTSLMFLVIYIDYFHLYQPDVIDGLRGGRVFEFGITPPLMIAFFTVIGIPSLMIVLSTALRARASRVVNLVVAALYIPVMLFNVAGATPSWYGYYAVTIGVELLILAFILRAAWAWPRATTPATNAEKVSLRQSA